MSAVSGYLLRLICAAILCALVNAMAGEGPGQRTRRLIAAVFLMLTALSPPGDLDLPELDPDALLEDAEDAVRDGTQQAQTERADIISGACEAYIWNKAAELGLELEVRVVLGDDLMPRAVTLTGQASPLERQTLTEAVTRDLGIGKEDVTWNDPYQSSA